MPYIRPSLTRGLVLSQPSEGLEMQENDLHGFYTTPVTEGTANANGKKWFLASLGTSSSVVSGVCCVSECNSRREIVVVVAFFLVEEPCACPCLGYVIVTQGVSQRQPGGTSMKLGFRGG
ncbi:hypothetical protein C8035_v002610 [Colletotrichum spinosum]|uniref:Uncharacterized protein n=1 Tax=Colletotrichum spinosum TaxID=1347390 RepID=A0A4R8Q7S9_9PEZI|nr:hypothetical protein C8035_v002610 [Colletotrichum spinosum]